MTWPKPLMIFAAAGALIIQRGVVMTDMALAAVNPKEEHLIHPVSYFNGPK